MRIKAIVISFLAFAAVMFGLSAPAQAATSCKASSHIVVTSVTTRAVGSGRMWVLKGVVKTSPRVHVVGKVTLRFNGHVVMTETLGHSGEFWLTVRDVRNYSPSYGFTSIDYLGVSTIKASSVESRFIFAY